MIIIRTVWKDAKGDLTLKKEGNTLAFVRGAVISDEIGAEVSELIAADLKTKETVERKVADEKAAEKAKSAKVSKSEKAPDAAQGS